MKTVTSTLVFALATYTLPALAAESIVVTDATDILFPDTGAVYRVVGPGQVETVASGAPLASPAGVLQYGKPKEDTWLVSDIGTFFSLNDGAVFLLVEGESPVVVYSGAPLSNPFGMLVDKDRLLVADFGTPVPGIFDGAIYSFDLDPDGDGTPGPFPLSPGSAQVVYKGAPLQGVNQMVWRKPGHVITFADDSGTLYDLDLGHGGAPVPFGPSFVDPVGLARTRDGFVVGDGGSQQVFAVSEDGQAMNLMLTGSPADQFLGLATNRKDSVVVANSGFLFAPFTDGGVLQLDLNGSSVPHSGPPLVNPFSAAFARAPRSATSQIVP